MKEYPLEVVRLQDIDNGDLMGYYTKGHHDRRTVVAQIEHEWGDVFAADRFEHSWRRMAVITTSDGPTQYLCARRRGSGNRGIFPVTIIEW